jgi:hypothetical protein
MDVNESNNIIYNNEYYSSVIINFCRSFIFFINTLDDLILSISSNKKKKMKTIKFHMINAFRKILGSLNFNPFRIHDCNDEKYNNNNIICERRIIYLIENIFSKSGNDIHIDIANKLKYIQNSIQEYIYFGRLILNLLQSSKAPDFSLHLVNFHKKFGFNINIEPKIKKIIDKEEKRREKENRSPWEDLASSSNTNSGEISSDNTSAAAGAGADTDRNTDNSQNNIMENISDEELWERKITKIERILLYFYGQYVHMNKIFDEEIPKLKNHNDILYTQKLKIRQDYIFKNAINTQNFEDFIFDVNTIEEFQLMDFQIITQLLNEIFNHTKKQKNIQNIIQFNVNLFFIYGKEIYNLIFLDKNDIIIRAIIDFKKLLQKKGVKFNKIKSSTLRNRRRRKRGKKTKNKTKNKTRKSKNKNKNIIVPNNYNI